MSARLWLTSSALLTALAACGGAPPTVDPQATEPEPPTPAVTSATGDESTEGQDPPAAEDPPNNQAPADIAQQPIRAGSLRAALPNGMTTMLLPYPVSAAQTATDTAEIALALVAGSRMGKQGAADLAAGLLAYQGDVTAGRPPLATAIKELGGNLQIEQGPLSTWFIIRVPGERWQAAMESLSKALSGPVMGKQQLEHVQEEMLRQHVAKIRANPATEIPARLLLGDQGSGEHLLTLQERTPGEAVLFQSRNYRPDRGMLVLRVPANPMQIAAAVQQNFDGWRPKQVGEPDADDANRKIESKLYWAPRPSESNLPLDTCRVMLVLVQPDPLIPDAANQQMLLNCLTMEGFGGRLEQLQRRAGLGSIAWTSDFVSCAEANATVLEALMSNEDAARMWSVLSSAKQSLRELPPTESERALAGRRAWLSLYRGALGAGSELRTRATRVLRGVSEEEVRQRLEALDTSTVLAQETLDAFFELPSAMIVIGGEPPAGLTDVVPFDVYPPQFSALLPEAVGEESFESAAPWMNLAAEALGGADIVRQMLGFSAERTIVTAGSPTVEEELEWTIDNAISRKRTLLGSTIETTIAGDSWIESLGDEKLELSPMEANWRLAEAERHPLALLIAHAHGDLKFRLLATRKHEGRDYVLLEAASERFERLRMQIDGQSGLVRIVEAWVTSPEGSPTYTVDRWFDYRTLGSIRAPFRRETTVDDGRSRSVSTYQQVAPKWVQ